MKKIYLSLAVIVSMFGSYNLLLEGSVSAVEKPVDVFSNICNAPDTTDATKNSTVCKEKTSSTGKNPLFGPDGVLTFATNFMSALVAIAAVIMIVYGGIKYMTSGSNPSDVNKAREMILYALVGVVIAGAAQLLVRLFLYNIGQS